MQRVRRSYRLDLAAAEYFDAVRLSLRERAENGVVGRYGRHGSLQGTLSERVLSGTWRSTETTGWITVTFAPDFRSFEGRYGVAGGWSGAVSGTAVRPSRPPLAQRRSREV